LRPATQTDVAAIAELWHDGWVDGHRGHVPAGLLAHRGPADFHQRVPDQLAATTVAVDDDDQVIGFATVRHDELEQLYVAATARGSGVADALIAHAESLIAHDHELAWLAVVAGNARARAFYERCGWRDDGPLDYRAAVDGGTFVVPCRRYVKPVGPAWPVGAA
jgi:putative acetyltransferase